MSFLRLMAGAALMIAMPAAGPLPAQETQPAATTQFSSLTYMTRDHIQPQQGTIEWWIRPDVDVTKPPGRFHHFFLLRLAKGKRVWGDQGALSVVWLERGGLFVMATDGPREASVRITNLPNDKGNTLRWAPGSWHHVALTWNGTRVRLYTDGELLAETQASAPLPIADPGFIVLGHGQSRIAVDELVISSVERTGEQIKQRMSEAPAKDEHTLLLDPMETLEPTNGRANPLRSNAATLVEGKFGQALQLYQ
jgi:hypothetical protein